MIILNDKYSFKGYQHGWVLYTWQDGFNKQKEPTRTSKETYHTNLEQVANAILEKESKLCENMGELMSLLRAARYEMKLYVEDKERRSK